MYAVYSSSIETLWRLTMAIRALSFESCPFWWIQKTQQNTGESSYFRLINRIEWSRHVDDGMGEFGEEDEDAELTHT